MKIQSTHSEPMLKPGTFDGRTVVITGGGSGLGRVMACCLMLLGAQAGDLRPA